MWVPKEISSLPERRCGCGSREWRNIVAKLTFVGWNLLPGTVMAQSGLFVTPSVSLAEVYDDNIFSTPPPREADLISRVSPTIEAGYRSQPLTVHGRYTLDAESFSRHREFDAAPARQHAAIDFRNQPTPLLTFSGNAAYTETEAAGELNLETGLDRGRAPARRVFTGLSVAYAFNPRTSAAADYTFTRDELVGGLRTDTQTVALRLDRRITRRGTGIVGYTVRRFLFEEDEEEDTTSQVVMLGWAHEFTPRTRLTVLGGPRSTEGSVDPEASLSLRHSLRWGELSLFYERSESTVIGEPGTVATESVGLTAAYTRGRALEVRVAPRFAISERGDSQAKVFWVDVVSRYDINRFLSLIGSYRYSSQRGILDGASDEEIVRNVVFLGVLLTHPSRDGGSRKQPYRSELGPRRAPEINAATHVGENG